MNKSSTTITMKHMQKRLDANLTANSLLANTSLVREENIMLDKIS
jgi:hypothetical protein